MVWGQKSPFFLLIILRGVLCNGLFKATCSEGNGPCGETVTVTCTLNRPFEKIVLTPYNLTVLKSDLLENEKLFTEDEKISIEWTEKKVKMNIYQVTFSEKYKYSLLIEAQEDDEPKNIPITINVYGTCEPEITKIIETNELKCEVQSEKNAPIVWMDDHRKIYPATRTHEPEQFSIGFKFQSFLKWTEEMKDNRICCSFSYPMDRVLKESCVPGISAFGTEQSRSNNTAVTVVVILVGVVLLSLVGYLVRRKTRIINRARSLSRGPIVEHEEPEKDDTTEPPLLQPSPV